MSDLFNDIEHKGPYFVMLIGLPGVGKSTFRDNIDDDAIVLSTDDWIQEKADWEGTTYDAIWERDIKQATSAMHVAYRQAIKDRANIIVDRTNLRVKGRAKLLAPLPKDYFKLALVFQTPDALVHDKRLQRPGKTIPPLVMAEMRDTFELPTPDEGFDMVGMVPST